MLIIEKVLNVNVVLARDENGRESILLGSGIGFGKKQGDEPAPARIEREFRPSADDERERLLHLLTAIPMEYFKITQETVEYARAVFKYDIGEGIYIVLPDHLKFAVERFKTGVGVANRISYEIRSFYPNEYNIGEYAIAQIAKHTGEQLPEEEAANIAFHIINQRRDRKNADFEAMRAAKLISDIMNIIKYTLKSDTDAENPNYARFVTHMQYFAERFYTGKMLDHDDLLYSHLMQTLKDDTVSEVMDRVDRYFVNEYGKGLPKEELAYLGMHLERINRDKKETNHADI